MKLTAGMSQIIQGSQTTAGGIPADDPLVFQGDIKNWGGYLLTFYREQLDALSIMSDLLVSDQGRLFEAATLINAPTGPDSWQIAKGSDLPFQLAASVGRYLYASMLPVPAKAILCGTTSLRNPPPPASEKRALRRQRCERFRNRERHPLPREPGWGFPIPRIRPGDHPLRPTAD